MNETFIVKVSMRGNAGQRKTATRQVEVWADTPEEAIKEARRKTLRHFEYTVKRKHP